jgi:hypothetical protein
MKLRCARNRHNPGLLGQQPCQSDLRRRRLFLLRESANQVNDCLIRSAILFRKARSDVAEIAFCRIS